MDQQLYCRVQTPMHRIACIISQRIESVNQSISLSVTQSVCFSVGQSAVLWSLCIAISHSSILLFLRYVLLLDGAVSYLHPLTTTVVLLQQISFSASSPILTCIPRSCPTFSTSHSAVRWCSNPFPSSERKLPTMDDYCGP